MGTSGQDEAWTCQAPVGSVEIATTWVPARIPFTDAGSRIEAPAYGQPAGSGSSSTPRSMLNASAAVPGTKWCGSGTTKEPAATRRGMLRSEGETNFWKIITPRGSSSTNAGATTSSKPDCPTTAPRRSGGPFPRVHPADTGRRPGRSARPQAGLRVVEAKTGGGAAGGRRGHLDLDHRRRPSASPSTTRARWPAARPNRPPAPGPASLGVSGCRISARSSSSHGSTTAQLRGHEPRFVFVDRAADDDQQRALGILAGPINRFDFGVEVVCCISRSTPRCAPSRGRWSRRSVRRRSGRAAGGRLLPGYLLADCPTRRTASPPTRPWTGQVAAGLRQYLVYASSEESSARHIQRAATSSASCRASTPPEHPASTSRSTTSAPCCSSSIADAVRPDHYLNEMAASAPTAGRSRQLADAHPSCPRPADHPSARSLQSVLGLQPGFVGTDGEGLQLAGRGAGPGDGLRRHTHVSDLIEDQSRAHRPSRRCSRPRPGDPGGRRLRREPSLTHSLLRKRPPPTCSSCWPWRCRPDLRPSATGTCLCEMIRTAHPRSASRPVGGGLPRLAGRGRGRNDRPDRPAARSDTARHG